MPPITSSQEIGVRGCGAFWAVQHNFPSLHHCGYVDCPFGATCMSLGSGLAQPTRAHSESLTRLCDSDHQVTPQVQRRPWDFGDSPRCPVLCEEIAVLLAKEAIETVLRLRWSQGFTALHRAQERQWLSPILDLCFESVQKLSFSSSLQDANAEVHHQMQPAAGLVCSGRPEGRVLSCLYPSSRQTVLRFAFEGRPWQYKVLPFGLCLSPCFFTKVVECTYPLREVGIRILNYLDDWLRMAQSWDQLCDHRDLVLRHLSRLGRSTGKRASSPLCRENLFSIWSRLGEYDGVSHQWVCPVRAELPECFQRQDGGTNENSEAPGVYGIHSRSHATRLLHTRPLQDWLHSRIPRWAWHRGKVRVTITLTCAAHSAPGRTLSFNGPECP